MSEACWRNDEDYLYLDGADRAGIAWEFLRRNADYHAAASARPARAFERSGAIELLSGVPSALRWGLLFRRITDPPGG